MARARRRFSSAARPSFASGFEADPPLYRLRMVMVTVAVFEMLPKASRA